VDDLPIYAFLDSSKEYGTGLAVYQLTGDPKVYSKSWLVPFHFMSKPLTDAETRYWPTHLEMSGLVWCYTLNTTGSEFGYGPGRKVSETRHTVLGRHPETGQPTLSVLGSGQPTLRHQEVPGPITGADRESASAAAEEDNLGGHDKKDKQSEGNGNARN